MSKIETIITAPTLDMQSVQQYYQNRDKHIYSLPTQRNYVWNKERKSKLIQSLITNYPIGDLCVHFNNGNDEYMDGQQRSGAIDSYIGDSFRLDDDLEDVELIVDMKSMKMQTFKIAGKKFSQLDEVVRHTLLTRMLRIERFYNLTDNQINEVILRKNNGVPLTNIEKTRMLGGDVQNFVSNIGKSDFFDRKVYIKPSGKDDFMHEVAIYNILLYETELDDEFTPQTKDKFAAYVKNNNLLTDEIKNEIEDTFEYLNECFPIKHQILNYINIPAIYFVAKRAKQDNVNHRAFYQFINDLYANKETELKLVSSSVTRMRLNHITDVVMNYYDEYFK